MVQELDDMVECAICSEPFSDPRSLPCVHSFCLKCIERYGYDQARDDNMPCPICWAPFTVPETGMIGLPKNFYVMKLLNMVQGSSNESSQIATVCEACEAPDAKYCEECKENLCNSCTNGHGSCDKLWGHHMINIKNVREPEDQKTCIPSLVTLCLKHEDKSMDVFCRDCNMALCVACFMAAHKLHDCSCIEDVANTARIQMTDDIDRLSYRSNQLREVLSSVGKQKRDFAELVKEVETAIVMKARELEQQIERDKERLLSELMAKKLDVIKLCDGLTYETTQQLVMLENMKCYTEELVTKGVANDLATEASNLHDRTERLLEIDFIEKMQECMENKFIKFTEAPFVIKNSEGNILGTVNVENVAK